MVRCPSCDHDAHETYCPQCGCEDYRPDAKPLTGQELAARPVSAPATPVAPDPAADTCRECGHHVNRHWWVADEAGCHADCECTAWGAFPTGKCVVCGKWLDDHVKANWCSY